MSQKRSYKSGKMIGKLFKQDFSSLFSPISIFRQCLHIHHRFIGKAVIPVRYKPAGRKIVVRNTIPKRNIIQISVFRNGGRRFVQYFFPGHKRTSQSGPDRNDHTPLTPLSRSPIIFSQSISRSIVQEDNR